MGNVIWVISEQAKLKKSFKTDLNKCYNVIKAKKLQFCHTFFGLGGNCLIVTHRKFYFTDVRERERSRNLQGIQKKQAARSRTRKA